jgi:hypothetical protein
VSALRRCDARGLLTAVLERVEGEVREAGDIRAWGVDAEDAALVAWSIAEIEHDVRQVSDGIGGAPPASGLSPIAFPAPSAE